MGKYNIDTGYSQLVDSFNNVNNAKELVRVKLIESELIENGDGKLEVAIQGLVKQAGISIPTVQNKFPSTEVTEYLAQVNKFSNKFNEFYRYYEQNNFIEVSKQQAAREAERKDLWKLWRDKLVRWVGGVTIAILLYSSFVYLSEHINFIKIPVHDLVAAKTKISK